MMDNENTYRFFALFLVAAALAISITFRYRAKRSGERSGDRISAAKEEGGLLMALRSLAGLALWGSTLTYLIQPGWMAWAQLDLPSWLRWAGGGLMLLCLPFVYWLFSSLGKNVTHTVAIRREHQLVTHGPYRWVRHPLYTAGTLLFLGFSLLSANWFTLLIIAAGAAILHRRTRMEEARLVEKFGDEYINYMKTTGRYLPRLSPNR